MAAVQHLRAAKTSKSLPGVGGSCSEQGQWGGGGRCGSLDKMCVFAGDMWEKSILMLPTPHPTAQWAGRIRQMPCSCCCAHPLIAANRVSASQSEIPLFYPLMAPAVLAGIKCGWDSGHHRFARTRHPSRPLHRSTGGIGMGTGNSSDDALINENMPPARCQVYRRVGTLPAVLTIRFIPTGGDIANKTLKSCTVRNLWQLCWIDDKHYN